MSGEFFPLQIIYQGKTKASLPRNFSFPKGFCLSQNPKHHLNETQSIALIDSVDKGNQFWHKIAKIKYLEIWVFGKIDKFKYHWKYKPQNRQINVALKLYVIRFLKKMKSLISDESKFKRRTRNPTKARENNMITYLRKLKRDGIIDVILREIMPFCSSQDVEFIRSSYCS